MRLPISVPQPAADSPTRDSLRETLARGWRPAREGLRRHAWLGVPLVGAMLSRGYSTLLLWVAARQLHVPLLGPVGVTSAWDARWYLGIAANGYHRAPLRLNAAGGEHDYAFFPLWPTLIRAVSSLGLQPSDVAAILSALLFCVAAVLIAAALEPAFGRLVATDATLLLGFSPAAWVFSMGYSESLFLVLAATAVIARRSGPRAIATVGAVLSRIAGLPLVAVELLEVLRTRGRDRGALLVAGAGAAAFAAWWIAVALIAGDPLGFLRGSPDWVRLSGLSEVAHVVETANPRLLGELGIYAIALIGAIVAWQRSRPLGTFAILALALGLLPGGLVGSMPRYALSAFPAFAGLAVVAGRRATPWLIGLSAIVQIALVAASFAPIHAVAP